MNAKLSICIPTYNRAVFLEETLKALDAQWQDCLELVISDNGSTDDTEYIVQRFKERHASVVYHRFPSNMGPDRNFMKVVELASGEYCWLMGSDDMPAPGAVSELLANLNSQADFILLNLNLSSFSMEQGPDHHWLPPGTGNKHVNFANRGEGAAFLSHVRPLMGLFLGYISSIVVKRETWDATKFDEAYIGSFYSFTYMLIQMINNGATLLYIERPLVLNRGYNDSMVNEKALASLYRRFELDINAYLDFASKIKDVVIAREFLDIGRRNFTWFPILKLKLAANHDEWATTKSKLKKIGCSSLLISAMDLVGRVFGPFINLLYTVKRKYLPRTRLIPKNWY